MRRNYFYKVVKYMKKVFNIDEGLNRLSDGRKNPNYNTKQVVLPVLLGFLLRVRSFNYLKDMILDDDFKRVIPRGTKLPKVDAIRDTLKVIEIEGLRKILKNGVRKARENKIFKNVIKTQVELVRQFEKGLYTVRKDKEIIFNTG